MAVGFPSTRSRSHRLPGLYPPADGPGRGFAPQARRRATMMWEKGNATYTRHLATLDGSVIVRVACACVGCRLALVVHRELWSRVKLLRVRWMARQLFGVQEVGIGIAVVGLGRCNWFGLVRRRTSSRVRAGAQNSTRLLECDGPWAMDVRALLVLLRIAMEKRWTRFVAKRSVLPCLSREPPTSAGAGEGNWDRGLRCINPIGNRDGAPQSFGTSSQAVGRLSWYFDSGFVAATKGWIQYCPGHEPFGVQWLRLSVV